MNHAVRDALQKLVSRENPNKLVFVDSRRHLGEFEFGVLKGNRSEVLCRRIGIRLKTNIAAKRL